MLNPGLMQPSYYLPVNADILETSNCNPALDSTAEMMLGGPQAFRESLGRLSFRGLLLCDPDLPFTLGPLQTSPPHRLVSYSGLTSLSN